jgi:Protein of unknown function (DUF3054)
MTPRLRAALAWAIDLLLVLAFVAIGRASHGEDAAGFFVTLLPFLVGLQSGWLLRSGRSPLSVVPSGVIVWASTLVLGILLRALTGQGIALSFVIVTALVLAAFLLGWRVLALLALRLRARRTA